VTLRDAVAGDAAALAAILTGWKEDTDWLPDLHSAAQDREFVAGLIGTQRVRVALQGDRAAGFLALDRGLITALYVAEGARGQGLGSDLLTDAKAQGRHLTLWCFQRNEDAQAFYAGRGFTVARRTDGSGNEERLPDVCMVWTARKGAT
jgi:putative acetyltransferase